MFEKFQWLLVEIRPPSVLVASYFGKSAVIRASLVFVVELLARYRFQSPVLTATQRNLGKTNKTGILVTDGNCLKMITKTLTFAPQESMLLILISDPKGARVYLQ